MVCAAFNVFVQPSRDRGVTCRHPWTIIFRFFSSTCLPAASLGESNKEQTPRHRASHQRARESQRANARRTTNSTRWSPQPTPLPSALQCLTVSPDQQPTANAQQPPKEKKGAKKQPEIFFFWRTHTQKKGNLVKSAAVRTRHCAEPATTAVEIIATSTFGRSAGSALGPSAADFSGATPSHDPSDWQNWWEEYLNENDATDKDDGMGNYDREVPWRVMQPRHAMTNSGLCNPSYFNGSAFTGIHDANTTGDRRSGVSGVYGGADTNSSTYYTEDRPGSAKRQRLASVTRPAELTTMKAPTPGGDVGTVSAVGGARPGSSRYTSGTAPTLPPYIYPPPDKFGSNQRTTQGFSTGEWFPQRPVPSTSSSSITAPYAPLESTPSPATRSSVVSPTTMFGMEPLITDYESGFYSLWNGTNGANVMGYEADTDRAQLEGNQVYMPEEELKMEYAQLSDLNQGDLDYIYGTMDSGPSPSSTSMRDAQPDRLFPAGDRLKRERSSEDKALTSNFQAPPGSSASFPSGGFRSLARNANIEVKRSAQPPHPYQPTSNTLNQPSSSTTEVPTGTAAGNTGARRPGSTVAKRPRSRQCDFPGCTNRARSHQKCKKHGGAHQCVFEGCTKNSQSRGLCIAHGGGSRCKVEGCTRASQSKGLCKSHGGGEYCAVEGCRKKAHLKHLCRTHGGGVRCKNAKCMKWAQRKGWCMAHAKEMLGS